MHTATTFIDQPILKFEVAKSFLDQAAKKIIFAYLIFVMMTQIGSVNQNIFVILEFQNFFFRLFPIISISQKFFSIFFLTLEKIGIDEKVICYHNISN